MLGNFLAIELQQMFSKEWWFVTAGAISTIGLYSILYRENKFYRLVEHIFLGLGAGTVIALVWTEELRQLWWIPFYDRGYYLWVLPVPVALLGFTVFSRKHGWLSRIPIGIFLGLWAGQQFKAWSNRWLPQVQDSMVPVVPTHWQLVQPEVVEPNQVYISTAINNLILVATTVCVLTYFFFSFEQKFKAIRGTAQMGRWLLMIAFGAIFGSTIMNRFILMIDRMYFLLIEWLQLRMLLGIGPH
ncbi:MAG: hypothetical protein AMXMBFR61_24750 [Fimbriimonadales bacterium]